MMTKPVINSFSTLAPLLVQQYETYLPTAFDNSLSLLEKVNKVIQYCNSIGQINNDVVTQWNTVMNWVMTDGLTDDVNKKIDDMVTNGSFDTIINQNIFGDLNNKINTLTSNVNRFMINALYPPNNLIALKGDGTDETTTLQSLIDYVSSNLLTLYVPNGTYYVKGVLIPSNLSLIGESVENTVFKLPNNANTDVFRSKDFLNLTGTNSNSGQSKVCLRDFRVNGNKENNTSGWGLRKYGYRWEIKNVVFANCSSGGLHSEWGTNANAGADGDFMEDMIENVRSIYHSGHGIQWKGPHDSKLSQILVYFVDGCGISIEGSDNYSSAGIMMNHVHVYGAKQHGIQTLGVGANANILGTMIESESNDGDGVHLTTNQNQIIGGSFYLNKQSGINIANNSSGNVLQFQSQANVFSQLTFAQDGGNNLVQASTWNSDNDQVSTYGTISPTTILTITGTGGGDTTQKTKIVGVLEGNNATRFFAVGSGNGVDTVFPVTISNNSPFTNAPYIIGGSNQPNGMAVQTVSHNKGGDFIVNVVFDKAPPTGNNNIAFTFMMMV